MTEPTRLFDLLEYAREKYGNSFAFSQLRGASCFHTNISQAIDYTNLLSVLLLQSQVKKGDRVALFCTNRPEWNFADMAVTQLGAILVPLHYTLSRDDFRYILSECRPRVLLAENQNLCAKATACCRDSDIETTIMCIEDELVRLPLQPAPEIAHISRHIKSSDTASITYTSGSTGSPKGVILTHENILSNVKAIASLQHLTARHKAMSFLPLSHIFERTLNYHYIYLGINIYYPDSIQNIFPAIRRLKINGFATVPRILERIFNEMVTRAKSKGTLKKIIFKAVLTFCLRYTPMAKQGFIYRLRLWLARAVVLRSLKRIMGQKIHFISCGGAALQPRLVKLFWAAGLPVFEGYGLTETSPVIATNYYRYHYTVAGTVGPLLPGVEVKIASDGEICCKSPGNTPGYYKQPELTQELFDTQGWLKTGDLGELIENPAGKNYRPLLRIIGRKKEMFKTSTGKYIVPQKIETTLKESLFIEQVMVVGENKPYAAALIVPNFRYLHKWAAHNAVFYADNCELIAHPNVLLRFRKEIDRYNSRLSLHEQLRNFRLLHQEWSLESGELCYTLKIKREAILSNQARLIESMYEPCEFWPES